MKRDVKFRYCRYTQSVGEGCCRQWWWGLVLSSLTVTRLGVSYLLQRGVPFICGTSSQSHAYSRILWPLSSPPRTHLKILVRDYAVVANPTPPPLLPRVALSQKNKKNTVRLVLRYLDRPNFLFLLLSRTRKNYDYFRQYQ